MSHPSHDVRPDDETAAPPNLSVIHLIKGLGPGGAERLIVNQLQTGDMSIDYTVLRLIEHKDHLVKSVEATGAESRLIGGGALWPLALRKRLRDLDPDVVHAHSPVLAIVTRLIVRLTKLNIAVVTTEHNRWPRHHRMTRIGNRLTSRFDDARIAVSADVRDSMSATLRSSTVILDHGVPLAPLISLRSKRGEMRARLLGDRADDLTVIGIVANFRPEKAYDIFLDAAEFVARHRDDVRFLVVGQGPGEAAFRDEVRGRGLVGAVEVLGFRDDATEVMSAFDIFTLTSRHEGKPVSIMEAFALGLPVVATMAGGIPEAVTHDHNGLLAKVDDAQGVADAWLRLVDDVELRDRLAHAAAGSAADFDASVATRSIEAVYRSVVG